MEPCHGSMAHFPAVNFHGLAIPVFEVLEFLRVLVELGDDVVSSVMIAHPLSQALISAVVRMVLPSIFGYAVMVFLNARVDANRRAMLDIRSCGLSRSFT